MENVTEALALLQRQAVLQQGLRQSNANRILDERELYLIRQRLTRYPAAVQAIGIAAADLHRPIDTLSVLDVERLA